MKAQRLYIVAAAVIITSISIPITFAETENKSSTKEYEVASEKREKTDTDDEKKEEQAKDTSYSEKISEDELSEKKDAEDAADQISGEKASRIAVLQSKLAELEDGEDDADDSFGDGNPHAERLRDPDAIKEAIEQLKAGDDICTRCLMECGAAS